MAAEDGGLTVDSLFASILRRDRAVMIAAWLAAIVLAWGYLLSGAGMSMHEMDGMLMPMRAGPWTASYALVLLAMWSVMMAAMMLPGSAPMLLLFSTITRARRSKGVAAPATGTFVVGYLAIWGAFSLAAVALQFALEQAALLSPMMQTTNAVLAGSVLIAAGVYQWTPLKATCLSRCRSPLEFILTHWRDGTLGAFVMGVQHGLYCVGCCWMVMLLLFAGGVMNIVWIAGLTVFVLVEKIAPAGHWIGRAAGGLLIVWGAATVAGA